MARQNSIPRETLSIGLRGGVSLAEDDDQTESDTSSQLHSSSESRSHHSIDENHPVYTESKSIDDESSPEDDEPNFKKYGPNDRILTDEETIQLINEWDNDTHWANVSLLPLNFGDPTPEEIQWEEERLHGDLIAYRNTGVPSAKWRTWRAAEDERKAAGAAARRNALRSAEELSLPSEWSEDAEPNWSICYTPISFTFTSR